MKSLFEKFPFLRAMLDGCFFFVGFLMCATMFILLGKVLGLI